MKPSETWKSKQWKAFVLEITWRPNWELFLEVTQFELFFGKVWENPGKIPSHPQKFTCSYTYG